MQAGAQQSSECRFPGSASLGLVHDCERWVGVVFVQVTLDGQEECM